MQKLEEIIEKIDELEAEYTKIRSQNIIWSRCVGNGGITERNYTKTHGRIKKYK